MFKTFRQAFMIRGTESTNQFIYSLKRLPILRKLLHNTAYAQGWIKIIAYIFFFSMEVIKTFIGKFIYFFFMYFLPLVLVEDVACGPDRFLHLFVFLTLAGGMVYFHLFTLDEHTRTAVFHLRMDAKQYILSNYLYFLIRHCIGFLPASLVFGAVFELPVWLSLLLPLTVLGCKMTFAGLSLRCCNRFGFVFDEKKANKFMFPLTLLTLAAGYIPYIAGTEQFWLPRAAFFAVTGIMLLFGLLSWRTALRFTQYKEVMGRLFRANEVVLEQMSAQRRINSQNQISGDVTATSTRSGFEYLNDIFVKRHKKILWSAVWKIMLIEAAILAGIGIVLVLSPETRGEINRVLVNYLTVVPFLLYIVNRGSRVTECYFMNCDHSLLTYSFFKKPRAILKLFRIRLRFLMKINALPAAVIGIGYIVLTACTGGTDNPVNYVVMLVAPLALSAFFSVHYLMLYYLLQPYTAGSEMKSKLYGFFFGLTYLPCYILAQHRIPALLFGGGCILFCVLYFAIACLLVYLFAHKTFRLHN